MWCWKFPILVWFPCTQYPKALGINIMRLDFYKLMVFWGFSLKPHSFFRHPNIVQTENGVERCEWNGIIINQMRYIQINHFQNIRNNIFAKSKVFAAVKIRGEKHLQSRKCLFTFQICPTKYCYMGVVWYTLHFASIKTMYGVANFSICLCEWEAKNFNRHQRLVTYLHLYFANKTLPRIT